MSSAFLETAGNPLLGNPARSFTVAGWVYISGTTVPDAGCLLSGFHNGTYSLNWIVGFSDTQKLYFTTIGTSEDVTVTADETAIFALNFYFVACSYDFDTKQMRIRINANSPQYNSRTTQPRTSTSAGGVRTCTHSSATHRVDEFGIWPRVLTEVELDELYNSSAGITPPFAGGSQNEIQEIDMVGVDTPTYGTFDITLTGYGTATLDFDEDATGATTKLEAAFGNGVSVTNGPLPTTALTVEFTDALAAQNLSLMTVDNSGMHGNCQIDWSVDDLKRLTLVPGSGTYPIPHVNVIAGRKLSASVTSNAASGTIDWSTGDATVDWGPFGAPPVPPNGETIYLEFESDTTTSIRGRYFFNAPVSIGTRAAAIGTAYQPSLVRDVQVFASVEIDTGVGGDGKIELLCDASNPPTTVVGTFRVGTSLVVAGGQLSCVVPAGYYYKLLATDTSGTPTQSVVGAVQEVGL